MLFSKTWAAVLATFAIVSVGVLIVVSRTNEFAAMAIVAGLVAIVCVSFLYAKAAFGSGDAKGASAETGAAAGESAARVDDIVRAIGGIIDGEKPDLSGLDLRLRNALAEVSSAIEGLSSEISELSPSDELTSLAKESVFNNVLWREFNRSERYKEPMSLVLLEVPELPDVIGKHGGKEGDRLLKHVASTILQTMRETDLAARYGDDRFAVIMPQTGRQGALDFIGRLRKAIEEGRIDIDGGSMAITIATGAASVPGEGIKTAPDLVDKAARALDEAKLAGHG